MCAGDSITYESVTLDGFTIPHKPYYEHDDLRCEMCHDWRVIFGDIRNGRMDGTHTAHPHEAKHIVILSIGSKKYPTLACDACKCAGIGAVAIKWGWDGSVPLNHYRMMRQWNRPNACAYSEC